jgi:hypothetical protein
MVVRWAASGTSGSKREAERVPSALREATVCLGGGYEMMKGIGDSPWVGVLEYR